MKLAAAVILVLAHGCAGDARTRPAHPQAQAQAQPQPPGAAAAPGLPSEPAHHVLVDPGAASPRPAREAIAVLSPASGSAVTGRVRFREVEGGLEVVATVTNLPAGTHAYHVHVYGDCSAPDAASAGPHFHFTGSSFDKEVPFITGNLGELRDPGEQRRASHQARIPNATLQGKFSLVGRAVVVHAKGNDPSVTPDGGAGARIACGVIGLASPEPPRAAGR